MFLNGSVSKYVAKPLVNRMKSLMLLHHKDSTQEEFKLIVLKKKVNVFASGEKTVSESYECVHKFVNLKHAISGMGGVMC